MGMDLCRTYFWVALMDDHLIYSDVPISIAPLLPKWATPSIQCLTTSFSHVVSPVKLP